MGLDAERTNATAELRGNGDEDGEPAEAAFSVTAMSPVLSDAHPSSVAATASAFFQAGNVPSMKTGVTTNPLYQTSMPSAASVSTTTHLDLSTSTVDNNKTSSRDCSTAAIDITANSSAAAADMSAPSTAASPHLSDSTSLLAFVPKPAQPVAESGSTIPAHYQQQRQAVRMRPSQDILFVARREGFTEVKESGPRTEEEKARGMQRSPDSILFKWGQHSSQLVCFAEQPFLVSKLLLCCKAVFLPALQ